VHHYSEDSPWTASIHEFRKPASFSGSPESINMIRNWMPISLTFATVAGRETIASNKMKEFCHSSCRSCCMLPHHARISSQSHTYAVRQQQLVRLLPLHQISQSCFRRHRACHLHSNLTPAYPVISAILLLLLQATYSSSLTEEIIPFATGRLVKGFSSHTTLCGQSFTQLVLSGVRYMKSSRGD
jgi:hypothetical protein